MSRFLLRITFAYTLWRILTYLSSRDQEGLRVPADHDKRASAPKTNTRPNAISIVISVIGVLIASMSAFLTYGQLRVGIDQQVAATRLEDLRFAGRIAVELDKTVSRISVSNYSDLPLTDAAVWTLGISVNADGDERLDTIRAPLTGLSACRTMIIPVSILIEAVNEELPRAAATEVYLTFRVPSGSWYTISERVVYEVAEGHAQNAIEAASSTRSDYILGDTAQEGVDEWQTVVSDRPIGPAGSVAEFATGGIDITTNGCAGPETAVNSCSSS